MQRLKHKYFPLNTVVLLLHDPVCMQERERERMRERERGVKNREDQRR